MVGWWGHTLVLMYDDTYHVWIWDVVVDEDEDDCVQSCENSAYIWHRHVEEWR